MSNIKKSLVLPVESDVRELDGKLLLACFAAEQGWDVYIGAQTEIRAQLNNLPPSIFIAKGMAERNARFLKIASQLGMTNFAWDEEGLVHPAADVYFSRRVSQRSLPFLSGIFSWGPEYSDFIKSTGEFTSLPVYEVGNPRLDLLHADVREYFRGDADALTRTYGRFILLNSNFARVNPRQKRKRDLQVASGSQNAEMQSDWDENIAYRQSMFSYFQDMFVALAKSFPDYTVILRPHPAESHDVWNDLASSVPNARVVHEGNVIPWLLACEILVQNGCTTAIESALLSRPVIGYQPIVSDKNDWKLPLLLSHSARTFEELKTLIEGHISKKTELRVTDFQLKTLQTLVGGKPGLGCQRIIDSINNHALCQTTVLKRVKGNWGALKWRFEKILRSVLPFGVHSNAYQNKIFGNYTIENIQHRVAKFSLVTGRFSNISVHHNRHKIFRISATEGKMDL